jgi:hypothetical protein
VLTGTGRGLLAVSLLIRTAAKASSFALCHKVHAREPLTLRRKVASTLWHRVDSREKP